MAGHAEVARYLDFCIIYMSGTPLEADSICNEIPLIKRVEKRGA